MTDTSSSPTRQRVIIGFLTADIHLGSGRALASTSTRLHPVIWRRTTLRRCAPTPDRSAAILDRIPAGRWGTPDDLNGAVVFLASPAASYLHGAIVPIDGGWLAR